MNASGEILSEKSPKLWFHWNWEAHLRFRKMFEATVTRNYNMDEEKEDKGKFDAF